MAQRLSKLDYKYFVAAVYVVALFMDLLDTTVVNVALPSISRSFGVRGGIEWVVTAYLLSLAVLIPVSGWAADRFGTKRTFIFALVVFTAGSLLCSVAPSFEALVAARLIQGVGGGMLTPVGAAMVYRAFGPQERARVSSIITVPAVLGSASGPIVGGLLIEASGWRSVFWLNVPMGVLGVMLSLLWLKDHQEESAGRLDVRGFLLAALGLSSLLYALSEAGQHGFGSAPVLGFGAIGIVAMIAFVLIELRVAEPMLDLRLFKNFLFRAGSTVQFFAFGAQFGMLFLLPLLLQSERGMTPLEAGLTTFPQAIGVMIMAPIAGRLYARFGPRRLSAIGLILASMATLALVRVDLTTSLWLIRGIMLARGCGFALSLLAMQTATFANVPSALLGRGSAMYSVTRQVGTSLAVAVLSTVLSSRLVAEGATLGSPSTRDGAVSAFQVAFLVAAVMSLVAAASTLLIRDALAASTMHRRTEAAPEPA